MAIRGFRSWLAGGCMLLSAGLSVADTSPPLRLLTFHEPPWVDARARPTTGIAVSVVQRVLEASGVPYEMMVMPPKRALAMAEVQPGTCVFPVERTQEREALLRWVGPVLVSRHALYPRAGQDLRLMTLEDARQMRIGSHLGSGVGEYLERLGYRVTLVSQNDLGPAMLARERIDLWVSDTGSAQATAEAAGVTIGAPALVFFTTLRAMGCHPQTPAETVARMQETLSRLLREGQLRDLINPEAG